ncbi:hypothetical protein EDD59_11747 [Muricomes intestini]|uniref:Uncharacterized protein n=1 Tax=Muricomes intestini TaxID=1796634 RepID=A0A4R3K3X3_9FIRM|nr:hypothetical protein EDD59_11747 [Muricomes intestini]
MCFYLQNSSFSYMDIRVILNMIPGSKGHAFHACMEKHDLGTHKT